MSGALEIDILPQVSVQFSGRDLYAEREDNEITEGKLIRHPENSEQHTPETTPSLEEMIIEPNSS